MTKSGWQDCDEKFYFSRMYRQEIESQEQVENGSAIRIHIPLEQRERDIEKATLPARLVRLLDVLELNQFGDLHGLNFEPLAGYRNCSHKTMRALLKLIKSVGGNVGKPICIPNSIHDLDFSDVAIPPSLAAFFTANRIKLARDLNGRYPPDLFEKNKRAHRQFKAVEQLLYNIAANGISNSAAPLSLKQTSRVLASIDSAIARLPDRLRQLIQVLWTDSGQPKAMTKIASELNVSKQQIFNLKQKALAQIKNSIGPRLDAYLQLVADHCSKNAQPLTAELLKHWMGRNNIELQRQLPAYVWLLRALEPKIWARSSGKECGFPRF